MTSSDRTVLRYDAEIDLRQESTHTVVLSFVGMRQRVLELGCATGQMSRVLQERGCQVVGIEADVEAAKRAEEHCERLIVGDLEHLDFDVELGERRFDVIVAADVLEHLKDPESVLRRLRPFLAPGGYLVASVPNVTHGSVRLALLGGSFPYADTGLLDRTHLRFYNRASLSEMLSAGEFSPVHVETVDLEIARSEVPFDLDEHAQAFLDALSDQPDALTYQFVVVAYPSPPPLGPIPLLLAELNRRIADLTYEAAVQNAAYAQWRSEAEAELVRRQYESEERRVAAEQLAVQLDQATASSAEKDLRVAVLERQAGELGRQAGELSAALQARENELREIHASRLWRVGTAYRRLVGALRER